MIFYINTKQVKTFLSMHDNQNTNRHSSICYLKLIRYKLHRCSKMKQGLPDTTLALRKRQAHVFFLANAPEGRTSLPP